MRSLLKFIALAALVVACGCSVHPIQDRVTGLKAYQIIYKLQCEARDAVRSIFERKGLALSKTDYDAQTARLERFRDELKGLNAEARRLEDRRGRLKTRKTLNELRKDKALDDARLTARDTDEFGARIDEAARVFNQEGGRIDSAIIQLKVDSLASRTKIVTKEKAIEALENKRKADHNARMDFYKLRLGYQVRFEITETNGGTAGASFRIPISLGSVTIEPGLGDTRERLGERTVKLITSFEALLFPKSEVDKNGNSCGQYAHLPEMSGPPPRYPIVGRVGLNEVIEQYIAIGETAEFVKDKNAEAYTDKIKFTTIIGAGVKPKITIGQAAGHSFTGNFDLSGTRKDIHEVLVSLSLETITPTDSDGDKITKVLILKEPEF